MTWLPDDVLAHLRAVVELPELPGSRYRVVARLGEGGMGAVYLADDAALDRRVAIKVLHASLSPSMVVRLEQEARTIARLEHPSIVPVHEVGRLADGRPYYVMKYVAGKTLAQARAQLGARNERLRLFLKLCDAVAFAHDRGVVHRDLKPENVMVGPFGELYVMDWGIAKIPTAAPPGPESGAPSATQHGMVLGTPAYMAPEQAAAGTLDHRADVYALGGVLRFLLETEPLPGERAGRVPRALHAVLQSAMAHDPAGRYASASDLAADVARFLDGARVRAHRESPLETSLRFLARNRFVVYLIAAYVLLRVVVFLFARR